MAASAWFKQAAVLLQPPFELCRCHVSDSKQDCCVCQQNSCPYGAEKRRRLGESSCRKASGQTPRDVGLESRRGPSIWGISLGRVNLNLTVVGDRVSGQRRNRAQMRRSECGGEDRSKEVTGPPFLRLTAAICASPGFLNISSLTVLPTEAYQLERLCVRHNPTAVVFPILFACCFVSRHDTYATIAKMPPCGRSWASAASSAAVAAVRWRCSKGVRRGSEAPDRWCIGRA